MKRKLKVVVTCALDTEPYAIDHIGVKQGLEQLNIDYKIIDPIKYKIDGMIQQIIEYDPDIVVHYMDNSLTEGAPSKIAEKCECKQIFWEMDYRPLEHNIEQSYDGQWNNWKKECQHLDHIFLSNKGQLNNWKRFFGVSTSYLPHGCYVIDNPIYDKKFRYPCVFIGGMLEGKLYGTRKELVSKISQSIDVKIINATERDNRNKIWSDMPKIYHSSDVVLDISHFWDNPGYASGRYFYSAGLGGCSITKRFPDCEELYPEGTKIYFDTPEEAVESIKYYQKHDKERETVKLKAFKYNKIHHTFKLRFKEIFKILNIKL